MGWLLEQVHREGLFKWLLLCITVVLVTAMAATAYIVSRRVAGEHALSAPSLATEQPATPDKLFPPFSCATYKDRIAFLREEIAFLKRVMDCTDAGGACAALWVLDRDLQEMEALYADICARCPLLTPTPSLSPTPRPECRDTVQIRHRRCSPLAQPSDGVECRPCPDDANATCEWNGKAGGWVILWRCSASDSSWNTRYCAEPRSTTPGVCIEVSELERACKCQYYL